MLPDLTDAQVLQPSTKRLYIGAYGFEERTLGWFKTQTRLGSDVRCLMIKYSPSKGKNKTTEIDEELKRLGIKDLKYLRHDVYNPNDFEEKLGKALELDKKLVEEIIVDITSFTKFLILIVLCGIANYKLRVRIIYSEAKDYAPTLEDYQRYQNKMAIVAKFPSRGIKSIFRANCLSSVSMQGQPISLIAFTSFNEQLVRHMLGALSPYKLILINGKPPRIDFAWREEATQHIHSKLLEEYPNDNPLDVDGKMLLSASTLDYRENLNILNTLYQELYLYDKIICCATGSKMQTVGLFIFKILHPDIQIEYPTPDSYYVKGMSTGIRHIHEVLFHNFSDEILSNRELLVEAENSDSLQ
jgi:hypothetical protein